MEARKPEFLTELRAEDISEGTETRRFRLFAPFRFYSAVLCAEVEVPEGFICDGESIPDSLHWIAPPFGQSRRAAFGHDYIYRHAGYVVDGVVWPVDRKTADAVYRELATLKAKVEGLPKWRATMRWAVLRLVGGAAWQENRRAEESAK